MPATAPPASDGAGKLTDAGGVLPLLLRQTSLPRPAPGGDARHGRGATGKPPGGCQYHIRPGGHLVVGGKVRTPIDRGHQPRHPAFGVGEG